MRIGFACPGREDFSDHFGMVFGLNMWAVLVLKKGKMVRTEGFELPVGKRMKEVNLDGYKYLGVLRFDPIMNREMKEKVKSEYIRSPKRLLRSQLNGINVIAGMNVWAVGCIRYGAGMLRWTKEELNGSLHLRRNVGRLNLARKEGRKGLISCEECKYVEVQSLDNCLSKTKDWMLKFLAGKRTLRSGRF